MPYDFSKYKEDPITKPRNEAWSNWAKFEKVGDKVSGFVADVFYRPAQGVFKDARCITLRQEDGTFINVAIKRLPFVLSQTDEIGRAHV